MRRDAELLLGVEQGAYPSTFRLFRFQGPTVSYGRLQKQNDIIPFVPMGWEVVQRPTGGGVVFHQKDICFSLCWPKNENFLPARPQDQYRWIHSIAMEVLNKAMAVRMAACAEVETPTEPFSTRSCFQNPVGYDLLMDQRKIVGGALRCTRRATLYQGSLQIPISNALETSLTAAFKTRLAPGS